MEYLRKLFGWTQIMKQEETESLGDQKIDFLELFNCLSEGIVVFDRYGRMILKNSNVDQLLGIPIQSLSELIKELRVSTSLEELVYLDGLKKKEFFINQNNKYLKLQFRVHFEQGDRADKIIVAISDYSEQKLLDDRRKDFVANVSHELKTPLTSILSYAEALQDPELDLATRSNFLEVVVAEANRMDRLIGDLLQLSKLSGEKFPLNRRRYPFAQLIEKSIEKIRLEAVNHNLTIHTYLFGELPEVMMDVDKMEQVILNVLSNAIKYTPEKGSITIYAGTTFHQVYAKITDTGIGIPEENLNRVFERFYRVDKARSRQQGGTGLGLAISKEIIEAHNGIITLNSEFGKGTEVLIKLPIQSRNTNDQFYA